MIYIIKKYINKFFIYTILLQNKRETTYIIKYTFVCLSLLEKGKITISRNNNTRVMSPYLSEHLILNLIK